jgi:hypothetical protein
MTNINLAKKLLHTSPRFLQTSARETDESLNTLYCQQTSPPVRCVQCAHKIHTHTHNTSTNRTCIICVHVNIQIRTYTCTQVCDKRLSNRVRMQSFDKRLIHRAKPLSIKPKYTHSRLIACGY